jgi:hypothetical protein
MTWGRPTFYAFIDHSPIYTRFYEGLPVNEFGDKIFLLVFGGGDLETPDREPVGVFHYAGIRRYLWRERYWSEYGIDIRYFKDRTKELLVDAKTKEEALLHRKLLGLLTAMADPYDNLFTSDWSRPEGLIKRDIYRVVYEIKQTSV